MSLNTGYLSPANYGSKYTTFLNPDRALTSNNQWAETNGFGTVEDYYNFTSTHSGDIDGIDITVEGFISGGYNQTIEIGLSYDGGTNWVTKSYVHTNTGEATYTYGGAADKWGRSWTSAELTNANFKVYVKKTSYYGGYFLDHVKLKVYYTPRLPAPQVIII